MCNVVCIALHELMRMFVSVGACVRMYVHECVCTRACACTCARVCMVYVDGCNSMSTM